MIEPNENKNKTNKKSFKLKYASWICENFLYGKIIYTQRNISQDVERRKFGKSLNLKRKSIQEYRLEKQSFKYHTKYEIE